MVTGPKLVIFDLDGTLIKFHHDYLYSETYRVLQSLNHDPVPQSILENSFAAFDYFRFIPEEHRETFIEIFWEMFDWENFPTPTPIEGSHAVLRKLVKHGVQVAIATSRHVQRVDLLAELEETGFLEMVSNVATREREDVHWTDKRGLIQESCANLGFDPQDAVMVGDIPTDISSARAVGIGKTVAVLSGGIRRDVLEEEGPDWVVADISHLNNTTF